MDIDHNLLYNPFYKIKPIWAFGNLVNVAKLRPRLPKGKRRSGRGKIGNKTLPLSNNAICGIL